MCLLSPASRYDAKEERKKLVGKKGEGGAAQVHILQFLPFQCLREEGKKEGRKEGFYGKEARGRWEARQSGFLYWVLECR